MERKHFDHRWDDGAATGWSAFESFSEATHVLTGAGLIVEANPAFERMFGAPRQAFYGRHQAELCDGTSPARQRLTNRILREASARGSWRGTLANRGDNGRRFTTRAHVYPARVSGRRYFVCVQEEPGRPDPTAGLEARALRRPGPTAPG